MNGQALHVLCLEQQGELAFKSSGAAWQSAEARPPLLCTVTSCSVPRGQGAMSQTSSGCSHTAAELSASRSASYSSRRTSFSSRSDVLPTSHCDLLRCPTTGASTRLCSCAVYWTCASPRAIAASDGEARSDRRRARRRPQRDRSAPPRATASAGARRAPPPLQTADPRQGQRQLLRLPNDLYSALERIKVRNWALCDSQAVCCKLTVANRELMHCLIGCKAHMQRIPPLNNSGKAKGRHRSVALRAAHFYPSRISQAQCL